VTGRLAGKSALVTGAGRGIGRALAVGLAAEGALVHVTDLELPEAMGGLAFATDISDRAAVRSMFAQIDRLDVLVNCAGVTGWLDVADPDEATWDTVIDTNLKGTFFCATDAAVLMRAGGGGSIVNISSVVAVRGLDGLSAYGATKGGLNALTIQLAAELGLHGIRVNAVAPGATNTERNLEDDPDYAEHWAPLIPLRRIAEPEDVVGPVVFFASDESAHVTGQVLYVDGGWTAVGPFPRTYVERASDNN
jgi:NAD(P)-dependent dehydrogenase (short-subunit alcohol dehydrogenase family)